MKGSIVAVVALFFVVEITICTALRKNHPSLTLEQVSPKPVDGIACKECLTFAKTAIEYLVSLIINAGIMGSCSSLCNALANKTGEPALGFVCDILCDIVGFKEFVKIIDEADLDPIYYCELLKVCQVVDNGDAKITSFDVQPKKGPKGTTFDFTIVYQSENGTGPGDIDIKLDTVDGFPTFGTFFHDVQQPGTYQMGLQLKTIEEDPCDPNCEKWEPGNYTIHISFCNGECGSKHPHSQIYDTAETHFKITTDNHT